MFELFWHKYKYFPYERELARREAAALSRVFDISESDTGINLKRPLSREQVERLVYFSGASDGVDFYPTLQAQIEKINGNGQNRQTTRYSAHGLHEYKGKFNPQVVRSILNVLGIPRNGKVLDPFCGSGTSLLECAHFGASGIGTDINPLAAFIANAKLTAFRTPAATMRQELAAVLKRRSRIRKPLSSSSTERTEYLESWFTPPILEELDTLRRAINEAANYARDPLLAVLSNLLRDYSLQDPEDLRIRRRKTPLPAVPIRDAFENATNSLIEKLEATQPLIDAHKAEGFALNIDIREADKQKVLSGHTFDCVITSPPYATALPYIDTQRLSLVWLDFISPSEILPLESELIGSRELRGKGRREELRARMVNNSSSIPEEQALFCMQLQSALTSNDGFRRHAVPLLMYRYFEQMSQAFLAVRKIVNRGIPFALIVGGNHTTLGGRKFDIDTPHNLASLAEAQGWSLDERIPLQTYQRYGYHHRNAVKNESLLILRAK